MDATGRRLFLLLVLAQAAHSLEELVFRLYDVLAPARFLAGLAGDDPAVGFAVVNAAVVLLGVWCYLARVRPGRPSARAWAWGWTVVELANGVGHALLALGRGGYFPGLVTAGPLLAVAVALALNLGRRRPAAAG